MSTLDLTPPAREGDADASTLSHLFGEVRDGLGTSDMSLEEMVLKMGRIRRSSEYEGEA